VNGDCLSDDSYCDTSVNSWLPGSQGWCGENALGLSCGCCAPFTAGMYYFAFLFCGAVLRVSDGEGVVWFCIDFVVGVI
jgi:hypothetical protein